MELSKQELYFELLKNTLRTIDAMLDLSDVPDDVRRIALKHQADIEASFVKELVNDPED